MNNEGQQNKEHISTEEFSNTRTSTMLQNKNTTFKKNPTNPQPNVLQGNCFFLYKHTYSQDIFKKKNHMFIYLSQFLVCEAVISSKTYDRIVGFKLEYS